MKSFFREYAYIPITLITAWLLFAKVVVIGYIPTASMEPNYMAGSVFVGLRVLDRNNIERGTPVLFHFGNVIYVKRTIGLSGDTVSFADGSVYIDGSVLDETEP